MKINVRTVLKEKDKYVPGQDLSEEMLKNIRRTKWIGEATDCEAIESGII